MLCPVTIHSVFSSAECEHIIALAQDEASGGFETARLVGGVLHGNIRRARISWLDEEKGAAWVLERIVCGIEPDGDDIAAMGVGGLLKESPARPQPREGRGPQLSARR